MPALLRGVRTTIGCALALYSLAAGIAAHAQDQLAQRRDPLLTKTVSVDIPAQSLTSALIALSKQTGTQVMIRSELVNDLTTEGVSGRMSLSAALSQLLKGTRLGFHSAGTNTVGIDSAPTPTPARKEGRIGSSSKSQGQAAATAVADETDHEKAKRAGAAVSLQEVVVTGTHIAGVGTIASPTVSYSQGDIYATGAGTIGELISKLPANFSEASEMNPAVTPGGPGYTIANGVGAVGFDIHGLGVQSTLVLVNGHRIASGNDEGNFADVSLIPLSAIERIDIVKDSASAVYGADAVGGVVNIITNTHFNGAETRVRYGEVTQGGRAETTASQTVGTSWDHGGAVLSYEYGDETRLSASSRSFSDQAPSPFSLLPEQVRHSVYGSLSQSLPDDLQFSGFVLYGRRTLQDSYFFGGTYSVRDSDTVDSLTSEGEIEKDFMSGDVARASVEYSMNDSHHVSFLASQSTPGEYGSYADYEGKSQLAALDLGYGGAFTAGNRAVRYAFGGQARQEKLSYTDYLPFSVYEPDRAVLSEYVEVHVPVAPSLQLTAAYRHEHYGDFGATNNPKIGLQWTPSSSIAISATYSQAFRAPALFDMNPVPSAGLYIDLPDPLKGGVPNTCGFVSPPQAGCTPVLLLYGGNPNLKPETAKSWTTTLLVHPASLQGLKLSASFYDVKYYDRINILDEAYGDPTNVLENESQFGSAIIQRGLPNQEIQQLANAAGTNLFNDTGVAPTGVTTLVDDRSLNLSRLSTRGIDFDLSYSHPLGVATVDSELEGTKILQYLSQFAPGSVPIDARNTVYNPISLKMRLHESVSLGPVSGSVFANYAGAYINNLVSPVAPIASWLTFDASISYRLSLGGAASRSASFTIGCLNVADRNPPYVSNPSYFLNFDGANASPLGRFVYAEARVTL